METRLALLIDLFAATKKTEGRSPQTIAWYCQLLLQFQKFIGEGAAIKDVTLDNARAFVARLQDKTTRWEGHPITPVQQGGLSIYTIHAHVRVLKVFGAWLQEEGLVGLNPLLRLKRPKLPQPIIEILTDEEIGTINNAINPHCIQGSRLYTVVLILLDTGIRAGELLGIAINDIDMNNEQFKVLGKGNKERLVPFSPTTKKQLLRYISTWRPEPQDSRTDQLILSMEGTPLTYGALSHLVKRLGETAGVPKLIAR